MFNALNNAQINNIQARHACLTIIDNVDIEPTLESRLENVCEERLEQLLSTASQEQLTKWSIACNLTLLKLLRRKEDERVLTMLHNLSLRIGFHQV